MPPSTQVSIGDTALTERPAIAATLRASQLFDNVTSEEWEELESRCFMAYAEKGDVIWPIGCPSSFAGIVAQGVVRLIGRAAHGREVLIELMGSGASFGLLAMIDDVPFHLEAEAVTNVWYLKVPTRMLQPLYESSAAVRDGIVHNLGRRLRHAHEQMCLTAPIRSEARLAVALTMLARAKERQAGSLICTKGELSDAAGVPLEVASKVLSLWQKEGLVTFEGPLVGRIEIEKLSELAFR